MAAEQQLDEGVAKWLQMVRGLLTQLDDYIAGGGTGYGMEEDQVWKLTLKMERMKRDGTWERSPTETVEALRDRTSQNEKRQDAIAIFPKEIWLKIIANVENPYDLWYLGNTCQLFESFLSPRLTTWMLEQALSLIYRHLSIREIIRCRWVCKSWRDAVDNFLQNHPSLRPYQEVEGYHQRLEFVCPLRVKKVMDDNLFIFCNDPESDTSAILEEEWFQTKGHNPFIGRFVCIKIGNLRHRNSPNPDQPEDSWWERFFKFLNTHGKEIWYLILTFPSEPNQLVQKKLIIMLESVLFQSMPNLRKLTIDSCGCSFDNNLISVEKHPEMTKLETLELMGLDLVGARFNNIFHSLVSKYAFGQLRKLRISGANFIRVREEKFENLTELILDVGVGRETTVFDQLNVFRDFRMEKLSKIHLVFPLMHGDYLFEDLLDFLNTMTALTPLTSIRLAGNIYALRFGSEQELAARSLDHPRYNYSPSNLKTLEMDLGWISLINGPPPFSFNFLVRYLTRLENLAVFARGTCPTSNCLQHDSWMEVDLLEKSSWELRENVNNPENLNQDEVLEVHRYIHGGDMYESRVWELFTQLKLLTVQWDVFTRGGYEDCKKSRDNRCK